MLISTAKENDFHGIEEIWKQLFTTDPKYLSIMFGEIIPRCTNYTCKEDGKIVSALSLMPMKFIDSTTGTTLKGWYMFGVGTLKEYWGKKLAAKTIAAAIEDMGRKGYQFIFERPANQALNNYYLNLGFSKQLEYIPHIFKTNSSSSTGNIENIAANILQEISSTCPKRFEWEDIDILKSLIALGELEFNNTFYPQNTPEGTFIAVKPLGNTQSEIFNKTFFCFPME